VAGVSQSSEMLTKDKVETAILELPRGIPKGQSRLGALNQKLKELFGESKEFDSEGLTLLEKWTGTRVRGQPS